MNSVICLAQQQPLFTGDRLPETTIVFKPLPELLKQGWEQPVVLVGNQIAEGDFKALLQRTYQNTAPLFVLPGFLSADLTALLAAPAPVSVVTQSVNRIMIKNKALQTELGKDELNLYCIEAIETPLEKGVLATGQERAVIWAYRPTRAATPVILLTVQLLLPSARSNPLDRKALWLALLKWGLDNGRQPVTNITKTVHEIQPKSELLRAIVIALQVRPNLSLQTLPDWLATRLFVQVDTAQAEAAWHYLQREEVLDDGQRPLPEQVARLVKQWGLQAWVREARRIEANYEA